MIPTLSVVKLGGEVITLTNVVEDTDQIIVETAEDNEQVFAYHRFYEEPLGTWNMDVDLKPYRNQSVRITLFSPRR